MEFLKDLFLIEMNEDFAMMNEGMYLPQMANTFPHHNNPSEIAEEAARRREIRLLKNREAARECRNGVIS